jgi:multidrug efflux system membrane fusion protein
MAVSRTTLDPVPVSSPAPERAEARPNRWIWIVAAIAATAVVAWLVRGLRGGEAGGAKPAARSVPVVAVPVRSGDLPITLTGLGSVTAYNTVTVRTRVDGQLVQVAFQEGQFVKQGDLLAEIDPRPYRAALQQADGQLARDKAQLEDAKTNLVRFRDLLQKQFISKQQYDTQAATVAQLDGAVTADEGAIAAARVNLDYTRILAPIGGRVGLRLVDVGNMVHASDANGIVVITQIEPSSVVFTVPEDHVNAVMKGLAGGRKMAVEAYDRTNKTKLADGELGAADNQIDPATGTFRLKAIFANTDHALFPNQFVNVRLVLDVERGAMLVPNAAIQRGPTGTFVYVVKPDHTADVRPVTIGVSEGQQSSIASGLSAGELVVVDGADKRRAGTPVEVREGGATTRAAATTPGA